MSLVLWAGIGVGAGCLVLWADALRKKARAKARLASPERLRLYRRLLPGHLLFAAGALFMALRGHDWLLWIPLGAPVLAIADYSWRLVLHRAARRQAADRPVLAGAGSLPAGWPAAEES